MSRDLIGGVCDPDWGQFKGGRSIFKFESTDIVFIGNRSCALEVAQAAAAADGVAIIMHRPWEWFGRCPEATVFDQGSEWINWAILGQLPPALRVFLAGDIPPETAFRPSPLIKAVQAFHGASARLLERLSLQFACEGLGLRPTSLHAVWAQDEDFLVLPNRPAGAVWRRIVVERGEFEAALAELRKGSGRPAPDFVCAPRADSALVSRYFDDDRRTVIVRPWRRCAFDTAFLDADLVERYARAGIGRIVVEEGVLILETDRIRTLCAELDLHLLQPDR